MEDIEQDPEEIPMDQVLAEIRQMLTSQNIPVENTPSAVSKQTDAVLPPKDPIIPMSEKISLSPSPVAEKTKATSDCFLLTPAMRCDLPPDSELSETVQKQTTRVLNKLQQKSTAELSPALIEWLDANLPGMVEKALSNHLKSGE